MAMGGTTRREIKSLDPSLNICLSEMHAGRNSQRIILLHGFTNVEIALKAQINGNENIGDSPTILSHPS